jgi:ABC-2 type transport system permease protein
MSKGLRIFAENQPITQIINAVRGLMLGTPIGNSGWLAVAWCVGTLAVAIPTAAILFKRRSNN